MSDLYRELPEANVETEHLLSMREKVALVGEKGYMTYAYWCEQRGKAEVYAHAINEFNRLKQSLHGTNCHESERNARI